MLLHGITQKEVARRLNMTQSTISRLRRRLEDTTSVKDRPRSGRPRTTTRRQDRQIRLTHLRNRFQTAEQTAATIRGRNNVRISAKTVRNCLREGGIRARRPYVGLVLMVWGGIANGLKTPLVVINRSLNAVKYRDTVLRPHVVPFFNTGLSSSKTMCDRMLREYVITS